MQKPKDMVDLEMVRYRVIIDPKRCTGCGNCIKECPYGVLELIDNIAYATAPTYCKGCEECIKECEENAIDVKHV